MAQIEDHMDNPRDDLTSYLLNVELEGQNLALEHVFGTMVLILVAGIDTTWSAIGSAIWHLAHNPDDLARLVNEPDLMPVAIEEFLRFYAPVTMARLVKHDMEYLGCPMKEDDWILLGFPAANRDPVAFKDADKFIIDRAENRHVAFGLGIHRCAGSNLARLEMRVALEEFIKRYPKFELAERGRRDLGAGPDSRTAEPADSNPELRRIDVSDIVDEPVAHKVAGRGLRHRLGPHRSAVGERSLPDLGGPARALPGRPHRSLRRWLVPDDARDGVIDRQRHGALHEPHGGDHAQQVPAELHSGADRWRTAHHVGPALSRHRASRHPAGLRARSGQRPRAADSRAVQPAPRPDGRARVRRRGHRTTRSSSRRASSPRCSAFRPRTKRSSATSSTWSWTSSTCRPRFADRCSNRSASTSRSRSTTTSRIPATT